MGKFWITDKFLREDAKKLSIHAQMVYIALCCHANKDGITFIGCRKVASCLGINKDTVWKKIKELEVYGHVRRLDKVNGKPSHIKILSVRPNTHKPSDHLRPKEEIKEDIKEDIKEEETYKKDTNEKTLYFVPKSRQIAPGVWGDTDAPRPPPPDPRTRQLTLQNYTVYTRGLVPTKDFPELSQ